MPGSELGPRGVGGVLWTRSSVQSTGWSEHLGQHKSLLGRWGWFGAPGSWYWEPEAGDFPARTWRRGEGGWTGGAWKDRAQQRPGRNLRQLGPQAPLGGLENRPLRGRGGRVKMLWSALSTTPTPRRPWPPAQMQRTAWVTLPPAQSARRPPPGREVAGPRRDTGPCVPSPTLRAGGRARWAPGEGRGGMRAAGGSFGTRGERDSRPASRAAPRSQAILL